MSDNIYKQSEDCLLEVMEGDILLYHPSTTQAIHLNESSSIIWQLCDGTHSVADIVEMISELYPEQAEEISRDVPATIRRLIEGRALELAH